MSKVKVLLLDGHTVQVLPLVKALQKNYHVRRICPWNKKIS